MPSKYTKQREPDLEKMREEARIDRLLERLAEWKKQRYKIPKVRRIRTFIDKEHL